MADFLYTFKPKRADFMMTMTDAERSVMAEHTAHLLALLGDGKLLFAGVCLDGAFAVAAFRADSAEAGATVFENDPAVKAGIVDAELHPFHLSMLQDKPPTLFGA
jgi:uncharacterized protein YciI